MKEKHVVLRRVGRRDDTLGDEATTPGGLRVEVTELSPNAVPSVTRHADVLAVAPSIPMRLIAPRDVSNIVAPAADQVAWGVHAVGADTSALYGDGIIVAVLDTGIDASHPAFDGVRSSRELHSEGDGRHARTRDALRRNDLRPRHRRKRIGVAPA